MEFRTVRALAAGYAASEGAGEAVGVRPVLGREGVRDMGSFGRVDGLGSHAPIVGRGATTAQLARVRDSTWMRRVEAGQRAGSPFDLPVDSTNAPLRPLS